MRLRPERSLKPGAGERRALPPTRVAVRRGPHGFSSYPLSGSVRGRNDPGRRFARRTMRDEVKLGRSVLLGRPDSARGSVDR